MKAGFFKRMIAYLIDGLIISIISGLIVFVFPYSNEIQKYQEQQQEVSTRVLEKKITLEEYTEQMGDLSYDLDQKLILYKVLGVVITIGYFCVFQFKNDGMTIGKKLVRIKVVKEGGVLTLNDLVIRSLLNCGIASELLLLGFVMILSKGPYLIVTQTIEFLNVILFFTIVFMILYRKDKRGLHDLLAKTSVIDLE